MGSGEMMFFLADKFTGKSIAGNLDLQKRPSFLFLSLLLSHISVKFPCFKFLPSFKLLVFQ